ncbi:MAG: hypothetical protein ACR5K7_00125 [Symbiopectobacterium sp.]
MLLAMNDKPAVSVIETMDQVAEICPGTAIPVAIRCSNQEDGAVGDDSGVS